VLFLIELGTRRIHLGGCTTNPEAIRVIQQARQLVWELKDDSREMAFLIHDNDTKFIPSFDKVFSSEGIDVVHTPFRAPRANAFAERWLRTVREEWLNHILVVNESHLRNVLREYTDYYNHSRLHQGISQHFPVSDPERSTKGLIRR
jgi:putative transposase